jgi:hypothetical protein
MVISILKLLHYLKQLLVLNKLLQLQSNYRPFTSAIAANLRHRRENVSDAEFAEGMTTIGHDDWLTVIKGILVAAPLTLNQLLHLIL